MNNTTITIHVPAVPIAQPVRGWGEDPKKVEAVIKDDPECLALFREAMKEQGNHLPKSKEHKSNNVTVMPDGDNVVTGNSRAYSIDRVKRECEPEVVAKVMAAIDANQADVESKVSCE